MRNILLFLGFLVLSMLVPAGLAQAQAQTGAPDPARPAALLQSSQ